MADEKGSKQEEQLKEDMNKTTEMVVFGRNDVFSKDYEFKELRLVVHASIKMPTIRERARIEALRSDILLGTEQNYYTTSFYNTLFLIQEAGKNTTVFETDDKGKETREIKDYFSVDGYPRQDVTLTIADDLLVWFNRFRG